jgi:hypothetical protein
MKTRRSPEGLIENRVPDALPDYQLERLLADDFQAFKGFAGAIIEASGKNPEQYWELSQSDVLDHVCLAAKVIKQVTKIEASIPLVERSPAQFRVVLHDAMVLASFVHQLTIVDNEKSIAGDVGRRKFLEERRTEETEKARLRNAPILVRAEQLRARGITSDRRIAIRIANERGGSFETIRKVIRKKKLVTWLSNTH